MHTQDTHESLKSVTSYRNKIVLPKISLFVQTIVGLDWKILAYAYLKYNFGNTCDKYHFDLDSYISSPIVVLTETKRKNMAQTKRTCHLSNGLLIPYLQASNVHSMLKQHCFTPRH